MVLVVQSISTLNIHSGFPLGGGDSGEKHLSGAPQLVDVDRANKHGLKRPHFAGNSTILALQVYSSFMFTLHYIVTLNRAITEE